MVEEISGTPGEIVDAVFLRVTAVSCVPPIAAREIIENLVHADFADACVSLLHGGATLRVSDCGPGIEDKARAFEPGYSSATTGLRAVIRGVGSGLAVASAAMHAAGGSIDIDDNLEEGTVVTLKVPGGVAEPPVAATTHDSTDGEISEEARRLLAVLLEVGPATPEILSAELECALPMCTRELVVLEHRGMVVHEADGRRSLTDSGTALLTTLF